jgi:hypothetical protein
VNCCNNIENVLIGACVRELIIAIVSYNLYFADLSISHGMSAMKNGDINSTKVNQDQFRKHHTEWLNTCLMIGEYCTGFPTMISEIYL